MLKTSTRIWKFYFNLLYDEYDDCLILDLMSWDENGIILQKCFRKIL